MSLSDQCRPVKCNVSLPVTRLQEERVASVMSVECPFLKEIKSRDLDPLRSLV